MGIPAPRSVFFGRLRSALYLLVVGLLLAGCETQGSLLKKRIKSVERGLLQAVCFKGQKPEKMALATRMQFYKVPGLSLVVLNNHQIEWLKAYGVKDTGTNEPATPETLFQAGALSQPVAAAAALHFVDAGRLSLDGDVNSWLGSWKIPRSGFTAKAKVGLRHLLTHSAGLPAQVFPGYLQRKPVPSLLQILDGEVPAENQPVEMEYVPESRVRYSESGFVILQKLLTDLERKPFSAIMKEVVLDPAGMMNSTFECPLPSGLILRAATGHLREGRPVDGGWHNYPELAAKGLWTTPSDLAAFVIDIGYSALGNPGNILSPATARAMLTPSIGNKGLGFSIDGEGEGFHFYLQGRTSGFAAFLVVYPAKGQGAVLMTNSDNGSLLADEILRAISAAYGWRDFKPEEKPLYKLDPSTYQQYVGRYQITPEYVLEVAYEDPCLVIRPTGQAPTKFFVESQTLFFSVDPFIRIQFRRDEKGRVDSLVLRQQDFEQTATKLD